MPPRRPLPGICLAALLGAVLLAPARPAAAVDAVTVDAGRVVNDTSRRQVGINTNYLMDSDRRRPNAPRTTQAAIQELGVRYLRYPGGEKADSYLWSVPPFTAPQPTLARTGPFEWPAGSRQFTLPDNATWIPGLAPLDFDEFMTIARSINAEPVIVVCYDGMYKALTPGGTRPTRDQLIATAAAWVRYANVVKGYNVKYWSLGNETDYSVDGNPGAAQYAQDLIDFSQAMKAVDPTIKIGAQGHSTDWFQTVLTKASAAIDYLDVHDYPPYGWTTGYETFRTSSPSMTTQASAAIASITAYAPAADRSRLKVIVSETGAFDFTGAWVDRNDLGHALVLFDIVGQHLKLPQVDFVQYWNTRWIDNDAISLPLGTTNLLVNNPGFEADLTGWSVSLDATPGNSTITTAAGEVHGGAKALKVAGATMGGVGQPITGLVTPGTVYTLSAWAKVTSAAATAACGVTFSQQGVEVGTTTFAVTATDWRQGSVAFVAPPAFDIAVAWCAKSGATDILYADDLTLVTGGLPSALTAIGPKNEILPSGRILAIWASFLRDKLVSATGTSMVLAYATKATGTSELNLFLLNKDTVAHDAAVSLKNYTSAPTAKRWIFTGSDVNDVQPTFAPADDVAVNTASNTVAVSLPPLSLTVLALTPPVPVPPNYGGMWWNAPANSESGWGLNLAHQGDTIFVTWFTYDSAGNPWWLVFGAQKTAANTYGGTVYTGTGPAFNSTPFDPTKVVARPVGTATLTFLDNDNATFAYTVNGTSRTKSITREVFGSPVPTCVWNSGTALAAATNFQDMWWAAPAGSESGWGVNIAQQGDTLVGTWFTYDFDGAPLWLIVQASNVGPNTYSGRLFTGTGPAFESFPFDPSRVSPLEVGTATFTFTDGNTASFAYNVSGVAQTKTITREVFAAPGTVCAAPG